MKRKRNPKKANLSAITVVDYQEAYNGKRLKSNVYGIVSRNTPFVYKNVIDRKTKKAKPKYINDMGALTNVCKQDIIAFFDDNKNAKKNKCYLIEK